MNSSSVAAVTKMLLDFTSNTTNTLLTGDLQEAVGVLTNIADIVESKAAIEEEQVEDFLGVAANLMGETSKNSWISLVNQFGTGADAVLSNIDRVVEKKALTANACSTWEEYVESNFYVNIGRTKEQQQAITFPNRNSEKIPQWAKNRIDGIVLPISKEMSCLSYSSILYKDLREIIPQRSNESFNYTGDEVLNSPVMSLSLFPELQTPLSTPATLTFQLFQKSSYEPQCSYWNKKGNESGWWDTEGCTLDSYDVDRGVVVCNCSHLTNFAILMSLDPAAPGHMEVLSVISLVGCITSMLCLVVTFALHLYYWKGVKGERSVLLLNLCVCLLLAYFVFLLGVDKVSNKIWCSAVAALLHFLYMSVFFIMLANSIYLAKLLLKPLNRTPIVKWCLLAAYGTATLVVGVSMGVTRLRGYGTDTSCWLSLESGLLWAFAGPALCVVVVNGIVAVIALKVKFGTVLMERKSTKEKISSGLRSIIVLMPVMGLTWVFGVFSVNRDTVVFQYIFAICNSLQGLLIFILHYLLDQKMRRQLNRSVGIMVRKFRPQGKDSTKMISSGGTKSTLEKNLSPPISHRDTL